VTFVTDCGKVSRKDLGEVSDIALVTEIDYGKYRRRCYLTTAPEVGDTK